MKRIDAVIFGVLALGSLACFIPAAPQQRSTYSPPRYRAPQYQTPYTTCMSDYGCGVGQKCVKNAYEMNGICADVTDRYGVKDYSYQKDPGSSRPGNPAQCQFDYQCGPGWKCIKGNGIYGNCMR